jgi:hypothetical protein
MREKCRVRGLLCDIETPLSVLVGRNGGVWRPASKSLSIREFYREFPELIHPIYGANCHPIEFNNGIYCRIRIDPDLTEFFIQAV